MSRRAAVPLFCASRSPFRTGNTADGEAGRSQVRALCDVGGLGPEQSADSAVLPAPESKGREDSSFTNAPATRILALQGASQAGHSADEFSTLLDRSSSSKTAAAMVEAALLQRG